MASSEEEATTQSIADDECLSVRKWWCFLLSSIFTFLAGLLVVLVWRACAFVCCRREPDLSPNDPKQKEQKAARQNKQEFEGTFMTEAKDWAGELISGQTTTGRILSVADDSGGAVVQHVAVVRTMTRFPLSMYRHPARGRPPRAPSRLVQERVTLFIFLHIFTFIDVVPPPRSARSKNAESNKLSIATVQMD